MYNFLKFLKNPISWYNERKLFKKRLAELQAQDPYIYK